MTTAAGGTIAAAADGTISAVGRSSTVCSAPFAVGVSASALDQYSKAERDRLLMPPPPAIIPSCLEAAVRTSLPLPSLPPLLPMPPMPPMLSAQAAVPQVPTLADVWCAFPSAAGMAPLMPMQHIDAHAMDGSQRRKAARSNTPAPPCSHDPGAEYGSLHTLSLPTLGLTMTSVTPPLANYFNFRASPSANCADGPMQPPHAPVHVGLPNASGALVQTTTSYGLHTTVEYAHLGISKGVAARPSVPLGAFQPYDIIIAMGGVPVYNAADAQRIANSWPCGQPLWANVLRGNEKISFMVMAA